ncbi:hypothetical protein IA539_06680 [Gordonia sp. zg691]|uniref:ACT domain-containing protein n=1 Tax=Gordonia jinghuaiqii TaxID=2758710 RepID=A0A7D7LSV1_9ACTN|nr:hypothetical protein [Gordonia jinghuaiqii]MBD0860895.1 hypothetical protein [Gordonia jinghuaiqii]MCR5979545.1 hypothetical protein [Gordonia jinghuaiqii]QMT00661.1 hypothetical protein H1R19_17450 [Gordonia jinghuaiqii]
MTSPTDVLDSVEADPAATRRRFFLRVRLLDNRAAAPRILTLLHRSDADIVEIRLARHPRLGIRILELVVELPGQSSIELVRRRVLAAVDVLSADGGVDLRVGARPNLPTANESVGPRS